MQQHLHTSNDPDAEKDSTETELRVSIGRVRFGRLPFDYVAREGTKLTISRSREFADLVAAVERIDGWSAKSSLSKLSMLMAHHH